LKKKMGTYCLNNGEIHASNGGLGVVGTTGVPWGENPKGQKTNRRINSPEWKKRKQNQLTDRFGKFRGESSGDRLNKLIRLRVEKDGRTMETPMKREKEMTQQR